MRVLVLLNESAGTLAASQSNDEARRVRDGFAAQGVEADVILVASGELEAATRKAVLRATARAVASPAGGGPADLSDETENGERFDAIIAGGGDGTLNYIASEVAGTGTTFGVLPLGTHNHFAKDLGVPLDLDLAVAALARGVARGVPRDIDVGEVNGKLFLNFSGVGLHPLVVRHREAQRAALGRSKFFALFVALWRVLRRPPLLRARLDLPGGQSLRRFTPSVIVCNNPHQMKVFGVENVSYADRGVLNVYVAKSTKWFGLVWLIVRAAFRTLDNAKTFESLVVPELTLHTRRPSARVSIDGEVVDMETPLRYRVRRGALRVIVPVQENTA
jgi:diacylglycerol kinase family enzyme